MQPRVKHEPSLDQVRPRQGPGRSKSAQAPAGGTAPDMRDASLIALPSGVDRRRDCRHRHRTGLPHPPTTVPVLGPDDKSFRRQRGDRTTRAGPETAGRRQQFGVDKAPGKMALRFEAPNADSWVLAKDARGATEGRPENLRLVPGRPLQFRRRSLHLQNPAKGGVRRSHGGTLSGGFQRGSLVKHPRHGLCTVGGTMGGKISLHRLSGKRLCQNAQPKDRRWLKRASLIFQPVTKDKPSIPA